MTPLRVCVRVGACESSYDCAVGERQENACRRALATAAWCHRGLPRCTLPRTRDGVASQVRHKDSPHRPSLAAATGPGSRSPAPRAAPHHTRTRALIGRRIRRGPRAPLPHQARTRLALTSLPLVADTRAISG
eukprot:scaffold16264_cov56-Phaeocystis_antarctica.AAC.2